MLQGEAKFGIPKFYKIHVQISCKLSTAYIPLQRKTIHVESWRWLRPPTPQFHVGDTNMLVSKNGKIYVKHKICVTPNTKPQCKPMEYRLCWAPNAKFLRWPCTFHVVCAHFICVSYPTQTQLQWNMGLKPIVCRPSENVQNISNFK